MSAKAIRTRIHKITNVVKLTSFAQVWMSICMHLSMHALSAAISADMLLCMFPQQKAGTHNTSVGCHADHHDPQRNVLYMLDKMPSCAGLAGSRLR